MSDALGVEAWVPISSSSSVHIGGSTCPSSEAALGAADAIMSCVKGGQDEENPGRKSTKPKS